MGISAQQFAEIQKRLEKNSSASPRGAIAAAPLSAEAGQHSILLGIDPSLRGTGFGVIQIARPRPAVLAQGTIRCPAHWRRSRCLAKIYQEIREVIEQTQATVCVIESLFFAQNLQTAILMGEARGASLAAVAVGGLEVYELAPRRVKQAIVGYGAAQKLAVAKMVQRMLNLAEMPAPDAADALALAIVHAQEYGRVRLKPLKPI